MDAANAVSAYRDSARQYSSLHDVTKDNENIPDYLPFPGGTFKNLAEVKRSEAKKFIAIKNQYLDDINRLKSLSNRLIGRVYDEDISDFYLKISGELAYIDTQYASLLSFRDTRYHLHFLVSYIESFLSQKSALSSVSRDRLCALLHECLSGINHCVQGSSSRLQSAFIRLNVAQNIKRRINQIHHNVLEYAIKLFLVKERASSNINYGLGNEVHWYNALYNVACYRFGLESIIDSEATLGDDPSIIDRFERALLVLMPERDFIKQFSDELYQKLISVLEKNNKQEWLTRSVSASELSIEIINDIDDEFFQPINMQLDSNEENKLDLWTIIESDDADYFYFSNSYERFQVWLINTLFSPTVTVVTSIVDSKVPHLVIGSMDCFYFWVFESANHLEQGMACHFDWDNHHTLSMAHLKNANFHAFSEKVCFNLLAHSIQYTTKIGDFLGFFLNKSAVTRWRKISKINPNLENALLEKLSSMIRSDGIVQELNEELKKNLVLYRDQHGKYFFVSLFCLALDIGQHDVAGCLLRAECCRYLIHYIGHRCRELVCAFIVNDDYRCFELLLHYIGFNVNSIDEQGCTALMLAARLGKIKFLEQLLLKIGINVNQKNKHGRNALMEAAENNHMDCLCALLACPNIRVNDYNDYGSTALILATNSDRVDCLIKLLAHGKIKVNQRDCDGWTALSIAVAKGYNDCLKALLSHKRIKLDAFPVPHTKMIPPGSTNLMVSARYGNADCLQTLLDYDARNINLQNKVGCTALMMAALGGDECCATVLLKHPNINIEKVNFNGQAVITLVANKNLNQRPWHYYRQCLEAAKNGNIDLLSESLDFSQSLVNARDEQGSTPMMLAAKNGHVDCLKLLLAQQGINSDLQDKKGCTALMLAANYNHRNCLEVMLAHGKVRIKNNAGQSALIMAAGNNHLDCLTLLLADQKVDINDSDHNGLSALMCAASFGYIDCLNALLDHRKIRVNQRSKIGQSALMLAAKNGFVCCLKALLSHKNIKTNLLDCSGRSSLMMATKNNHKSCVQLLLEYDPELINLQSKTGMTALMEAALENNGHCATMLLEHPDINIEKVNLQGETAFNLVSGSALRQPPWQFFQKCLEAASAGDEELLAEQINFSRALIHVRDNNGQTPLMRAARNGHLNCLVFLLQQKGINPDMQSNAGNTALIFSVQYSRIECLKKLLAYDKIDVNAQNEEGWTALTLAVYNQQTYCIKMLLAHNKVEVNFITRSGVTALMIAARKGHTECLMALLTKRKIKVDLRSHSSWTALMQSARYGHEDCVRALLEHDGIRINMQNGYGYTALMLAVVGGHAGCVSLLLQKPNIKADTKNFRGQTALELATTAGHQRCFQLLSDHNAQYKPSKTFFS